MMRGISGVSLALAALSGLVLGLGMVGAARPASAAFISEERLLRACAAHDPASEADCAGYIVGVADTALQRGEVCVPAGVAVRSLREAVLAELRRHPAPEANAAAAVSGALRTLYPCPR